NPAGHTPAALNLGLRAARGRYVVRMDAHTRYRPDYVRAGIERLARGDVAHASGPQVAVGYDRGSRLTALALASRLGVGGATFRAAGAERDVDSGFLGAWRREDLEALGGWDERWVRNQDAELAARLRANGGRLVCIPEMAAEYRPRSSLRALGRQYRDYGRYRARTSVHHPATLRRSHLLPPALVLALPLALAPHRAALPARCAIAAYAVALATEGVRLDPRPATVAALAARWATMHLSWGAGFLTGLRRWS
ncbi:MAG: glycosyl transferase, partial [Solirubrobacterales bacterium]|nr:glycosyl transferase [Solirubrobacterales bacterium]